MSSLGKDLCVGEGGEAHLTCTFQRKHSALINHYSTEIVKLTCKFFAVISQNSKWHTKGAENCAWKWGGGVDFAVL